MTGFVEPLVPEQSQGSVIADSGDPGEFAIVEGNFREIRRDTRYVGNDVHTARGDGNTVRWTLEFTEPGPRLVDLAATWAPENNPTRSDQAPFQVYDSSHNPLWTDPVLMNQRVAPNDFLDFGAMWERLDSVMLPAGETILPVDVSST